MLAFLLQLHTIKRDVQALLHRTKL